MFVDNWSSELSLVNRMWGAFCKDIWKMIAQHTDTAGIGVGGDFSKSIKIQNNVSFFFRLNSNFGTCSAERAYVILRFLYCCYFTIFSSNYPFRFFCWLYFFCIKKKYGISGISFSLLKTGYFGNQFFPCSKLGKGKTDSQNTAFAEGKNWLPKHGI